VRVTVVTVIAAPIERVWQALTVTEEVCAWDGVSQLDVPDDYPQVGQHALWQSPFGPFHLTLHDQITVIEEGRRMAAVIEIAFVHVDEEYSLLAASEGGTILLTVDTVRALIPGMGWLALWLTRANVSSSMARLKEYCERPAQA